MVLGRIILLSTYMALFETIDHPSNTLDRKNSTIGVFKAFDTINYNILLSRLNHYEIRGLSHDWFINYLSSVCWSLICLL